MRRKNLKDWQGVMSARVITLSNEVIHIQDASPALPGRYICLELIHSFFGNEDPDLTKKLLAERSGILNLVLDALDELRKRGKLLQPASGEELAEELAILSNFMLAFGRYCKFAPSVVFKSIISISGFCIGARRIMCLIKGWHSTSRASFEIRFHMSSEVELGRPGIGYCTASR